MILRLVEIKSREDGAVRHLPGGDHVLETEEVVDEADQETDVEVVHVVVAADLEIDGVDLAIAIVSVHQKKQP